MIDCPNKKCGSRLPDSYRYCVYCSEKLPRTDKNKKEKQHMPLTPFQVGIMVGSVLMLLLIVLLIVFYNRV